MGASWARRAGAGLAALGCLLAVALVLHAAQSPAYWRDLQAAADREAEARAAWTAHLVRPRFLPSAALHSSTAPCLRVETAPQFPSSAPALSALHSYSES